VTGGTRPGLAYYTVADAAFFPGAVALLNSLRISGNAAPLVVVDCGLTPEQRERLAPFAILVPRHQNLAPQLQKATGPLAYPADLMVIVDADILVTNRLDPLLEAAADGGIVAFEDKYYPGRWFPEWAKLGVGSLAGRPYVNAGLIVLSADTAAEFLPQFVEVQERLAVRADFGGTDDVRPYYFRDQDIFNAMLGGRFDHVARRLPQRLVPVPPFAGLVPNDRTPLACSYADGVEPYGLHHILKKPWLTKVEANLYGDLFTRAVTSPSVAIGLGRREIPLRLTAGRFAPLDRWRVAMSFKAERTFRGRLGLRPAIERRLQRIRPRDRSTSRTSY
jgi:hypothetical protein